MMDYDGWLWWWMKMIDLHDDENDKIDDERWW